MEPAQLMGQPLALWFEHWVLVSGLDGLVLALLVLLVAQHVAQAAQQFHQGTALGYEQ
jgi:hypothetical protein